MKRYLFTVLLFPVLKFAQITAHHAPRFGVELQGKKTSAHSDWTRVDEYTFATVTIAQLNALPAPDRSHLVAASDVRFPGEMHVYATQGYLVDYKPENDLDFHIVIADPENPSLTMIVEMVSPTMRQFQLATRADMNESALSRALSGRREFSTEERRRVAEILGFDVEWLFAVAMLPASASKSKELSLPGGARR